MSSNKLLLVAGLVAAITGSVGASAQVPTITIECLAPNGGFTIDGGGMTSLQQGEVGVFAVAPSGSALSLWSCGWEDGCKFLDYTAVPSSYWQIIEIEPAPRIILQEATRLDWSHTNEDPGMFRSSAAMAYDEKREVAVLFGGRDGGSLLGDTWEYDGTSWTSAATDTSPSPRFWHAMAYDSARHRIVIFGGGDRDASTLFNDTWELDGVDWQQVMTTHSPPVMDQMSMAFDSGRNVTVLFGGQDLSSDLTATWEYDGTDWTSVATSASPAGKTSLAAMAYDRARQRVVYFGYESEESGMKTWEYDGTDWFESSPLLSPPNRWGHSMAYDNHRQRIVVFGGYGVSSESALGDTWEYDGWSWTGIPVLASPSPREQLSLAYHEEIARVVMFGMGSDTWQYGCGGIVTGEVTESASSNAIPGVRVKLYTAAGSQVRESLTDQNGRFVLDCLADGNYYAATESSLGYIDELYSEIACAGGCNVTEGTPILVTAQETTIDIDFALDSQVCGAPFIDVNFPTTDDTQSYVDGCYAQLNGVTLPSAPGCFEIVRVEWDWGDGTVEDSWFPANHTYLSNGLSATVTATAHDSAGEWSADTGTLDLSECLPVPMDLVLADMTVDTAATYEACNSITASSFNVVAPGGDAIFRTGGTIRLGEGFSVESGCEFSARLEVPIDCP